MALELQERRELILADWVDWQPSTLSEHIDQCAARWPDRLFIISDDEQLTYPDVVERSWRMAAALRGSGVSPGDRVGIMIGNSADFIVAKVATARIGAIAMPMNYLLGPSELRVVLETAEPKLIIAHDHVGTIDVVELLGKLDLPSFDAGTPSVVYGRTDRLPAGAIELEAWLDAADGADRSQLVDPDPPNEPIADLLFTSGTTGKPKGALLKQDALVREGFTSALARALSPGWRTLTALPTFHLFGWAQAVMPLTFVGGALVLRQKFDAQTELDELAPLAVDDIVCVPAMLHQLVERAEARPGAYRLQAIFAAGDPVPVALWVRARAALGITEVTNGYGMTELCGAPFMMPLPATEDQLVLTVGRFKHGGERGIPEGFYEREFRVADPETDVELGVDMEGEAQFRGRGLFAGYWRNETETAKAWTDDGWFRSGDLVKLRPDGTLLLTGRIKDLYRTGGELVSPGEVERVLSEIAGVNAVYVVGVPDERWGEAGWAFVIPTADARISPEQVIAYAKERIAKYKVPKNVRIISTDELPKTAAGKAHKAGLIQRAKDELALADARSR